MLSHVFIGRLFVIDSRQLSNGLGKFYAFAVEVGHHEPLPDFHLEFETNILNIYFHKTSEIHHVELVSFRNIMETP
jgi:hypothetical protein